MKVSHSPTVAMLWSLCIPGFGQLYNRDYIIGLLLVVLEFIINVKANLNLAILYSFRGQITQAAQVPDYQWLLFYPCVYVYSIWQAYNRALELNRSIADTDSDRFYGRFIGAAMGGTLGIIYSYGMGPIFAGILGMIGGAALGWLAETRFQ